ncbi:hypothetical protein [Sphingorhabdus sp. SMR4y]|uniref:hypothetical protein n=1 Tax=Sphingorhabdus sp. SMR4y TaxID=2584094 RepID=UPI000B5CAB19|nr:hypothetical protein [Sphingorhabdus sp. SMR4y]ASK87851.1 hypothetical protein SPHFLASMR4Y_01082 [Sphingorhabdus sp. SMR4y]
MVTRAIFGLLMVALGFGGSASAKPPDELVEIKADQGLEIRADRAYLLFRVKQLDGVRPLEPLLMRVPTEIEIERYEIAKSSAFAKQLPILNRQYERELKRYQSRGDNAAPAPQKPSIDSFAFVWDEIANLQDVDYGDAFLKTDDEEIFLVEAKPGEYILYGFTPSTGLPRLMFCLCLGTVGFTANAGEVTDLGYLISDFSLRGSTAPELEGRPGFSGTVRTARPDSLIPQTLSNTKIKAAQYRAIGRFFTPNAVNIDRLGPVPDVLGFAKGKVINPVTGEEVPDNF